MLNKKRIRLSPEERRKYENWVHRNAQRELGSSRHSNYRPPAAPAQRQPSTVEVDEGGSEVEHTKPKD